MPVWFRFLLFVLFALSLVSGLSYYLSAQVRRAFQLSPKARRALFLALCLGPLLAISGRLFESALGVAANAMAITGFIMVVATLIATAVLAPVHLFFTIADKLRRRNSAVADTAKTDSPTQPDRRVFVQRAVVGTAVATGLASASHGSLFGRHDYVIEEVVVPITGLSPKLSGYRIVQLSDIHFGQFVGEPERRSAVELVRRARPDLVVLTGDLVDVSERHAPELGLLTRALSELGPRDGVVVIPGNHDYYAGIGAVLGSARRGGATVLVNQGIVLGDAGGKMALIGVDDVWSRRTRLGPGPDLARATAQVPSDLPRILLCHNPEFFPQAAGRVALQLSGHTHGGQVNPGVRPADLVLPYVRGLYRENGSLLYVNRGFGTAGPPMRVGAPPEVSLVVLTAA